MTVLWRDDYTWHDRPVLSANAVAFWDWLDAALDTLNAPETVEPPAAERLLITALLIPHARRSHPCQYRTDDLSGPCLVGRLAAAEIAVYVTTGYDEAWVVSAPLLRAEVLDE